MTSATFKDFPQIQTQWDNVMLMEKLYQLELSQLSTTVLTLLKAVILEISAQVKQNPSDEKLVKTLNELKGESAHLLAKTNFLRTYEQKSPNDDNLPLMKQQLMKHYQESVKTVVNNKKGDFQNLRAQATWEGAMIPFSSPSLASTASMSSERPPSLASTVSMSESLTSTASMSGSPPSPSSLTSTASMKESPPSPSSIAYMAASESVSENPTPRSRNNAFVADPNLENREMTKKLAEEAAKQRAESPTPKAGKEAQAQPEVSSAKKRAL